MRDDIPELLQQRKYDEALERLFDVYGPRVFRMALAYLRDPGRAEEATQDAFVKLWRALPRYDGRAAVPTWLYTIARNTCLSLLRRESYCRTVPLDEVAEPQANAASVSGLIGRCAWPGCPRCSGPSSACSTSRIGT